MIHVATLFLSEPPKLDKKKSENAKYLFPKHALKNYI